MRDLSGFALRVHRPAAHVNTFTSGIGTTNRPPHSGYAAICSMISSFRFHGRIST